MIIMIVVQSILLEVTNINFPPIAKKKKKPKGMSLNIALLHTYPCEKQVHFSTLLKIELIM